LITLQIGATGPMVILPFIPLEVPRRAGPASEDRYPPGETTKPATVDTVVRRRAARMRAVLLVARMIVPCAV
jgi:hypothetical protein